MVPRPTLRTSFYWARLRSILLCAVTDGALQRAPVRDDTTSLAEEFLHFSETSFRFQPEKHSREE